jgi:ubiquinone/menaquinone biosynthesis C-methylase UbiE
MDMQLDPNEFKESQRQSWNSVSDGWQKWWKTIEKGAQNVSKRLVELAHIRPGDKILDVATGIGEPAITGAKLVGDNGHVLATDISPQMLSIAKQRAASLGLENIMEFKEGDAETIDLPASSFNAVLCRWGLMFLPNLSSALSNIHKTLVPDGYLAAAVWATPDKVPFLALAVNIVGQATSAPVPPPGTPGPFTLADENQLRNSLIEIGFKDVHTERLNTTFEFNSAKDYTQFQKELTAPVIAMLANETKSRQEEIWNTATEVARKYSDSSGHIKFSNEAICIACKK